MRVGVLIAGILLGLHGWVFTDSIIGALVGIPMLFLGFILFIYGLVATEPGRNVIVQGSPSATLDFSPSASRSPSLRWTCTCGRTISLDDYWRDYANFIAGLCLAAH